MSLRASTSIVLMLLIVTSTACSFAGPAQPEATQAPTAPPAPAVTPTDTLPAPATLPPITSSEQPTATGQILPTDTPSLTPGATSRSRPPTRRPAGTITPLSVNYEIVGIKRKPNEEAVLTLRVIVSGGAAPYRYFNDNLPESGATFDVAGHCGKPFVHTIRVTSSDGQSAAVQYFAAGVCPTPTP